MLVGTIFSFRKHMVPKLGVSAPTFWVEKNLVLLGAKLGTWCIIVMSVLVIDHSKY